MSDKLHRMATIVLFIVFAAYGLEALTIPSFPGQEFEPFKPRTMPVALAVIGMLLAGIRMIRLSGAAEAVDGQALATFNWAPAIRLCLVMVAYGLLMNRLGFIVSTTLFLTIAFLVLGERRRSVLLFFPLAFSAAFFLLMTRGLGLYLAPGAWMGL